MNILLVILCLSAFLFSRTKRGRKYQVFLRKYLWIVPKLYLFCLYSGVKEGHKQFIGQLQHSKKMREFAKKRQEGWDEY